MTGDEFHARFLLRSVCPEDRPAILQFTANTWTFGDYIERVFEGWLADNDGLFLVAEERDTGRIAAIDKLSFPAPHEAWFEGLRVNPEFRGHGIAGHLQRFMLGQAEERHATYVRFLTLINNMPVHRMAYRDAFSMSLVVRFWKWTNPGPGGQGAIEAGSDQGWPRLRNARPEEAEELYQGWLQSSAWATQGLVNRDWSFTSTSAHVWTDAASVGHLLVLDGGEPEQKAVFRPSLLLTEKRDAPGQMPYWSLSAMPAVSQEWDEIARSLVLGAVEAGIGEITALLPDLSQSRSALQDAGFSPDPDGDLLCLFCRMLP